MSVVSGIAGASAQKRAASRAASAEERSAQISADVQREMFNKLLDVQRPYNALGGYGLKMFRGADPTAQSRQYQAKIENLPQLSLPELDLSKFNYAFNPNDPTYQYRQQELENTINQAAAARGIYNSRPVINALAEGNIALTADESEKQFGRALDTYNTNISTALSQYGADYGRSQDLYNTGYGKLTDLYNISRETEGSNYNKILDAIKIGQGAASATGQGAQTTGQGLANTYGQLGNALANTQLAKGQAQSDLWGNIGNTNTTAALLLAKYKGWI